MIRKNMFTSRDELLKLYGMGYEIPKETKGPHKCIGWGWVLLNRRAQRKSFLLPVKDQHTPKILLKKKQTSSIMMSRLM